MPTPSADGEGHQVANRRSNWFSACSICTTYSIQIRPGERLSHSAMVFVPPSRAEIDNAARDAVVTLRAVCGASATFFFVGSFACKLYGEHVSPYMTFRSPNDIDIVVETPMDQEELKRRMVQHNSRFFLVAAKTPGATYKVLKHGLSFSRYAVKVDVLIANVTLDIPTVPSSRVKSIDAYPTCPLAFLILLRLQAWDHHRVAAQMHLRNKAAVDYSDLTIHLLP